MKKTTKKSWMIVSALTLGMAIFTPHQAEASTAKTTNEISVQVEQQQIKGTIKGVYGDRITIEGKDGKNYYIGIQKFSDEQIEKMNLVEGQEISVKGSLVENYSDFYTFDVYKKGLPNEITKEITIEDLTKLEKLFNQMKKLEEEEKYDELDKILLEMDKIIKPYILAIPFEKVLELYGFSENNIVIKEQDKKQLKSIFEQSIKLGKSGENKKALVKFDEFEKALQPYLDKLYPPVTFEEYISDMELDISTEDLSKLKTIYKDIQKAYKDNNDQLSEKLWSEFHEMIKLYSKPLSFEEYMSDFHFEIKADDQKQLKKLYEEATALDKKGENEKSVEKWVAMNKILNPYFEANKEILISASKVKINGKVYFAQNK